MRMWSRKRAVDGLTALLFLAGICSPLLVWAAQGVPPPGKLPEERLAAPLPAPPRSIAEWSAYPRAFEDWFGDALGGRPLLLRARNLEYLYVLHQSPTPIAYIGRDHWVFLSPGHEFEMQRGAVPFAPAELQVWVEAIRARQEFCRQHGAEYLYVIAPDKTAIYPERHALELQPCGPSRTDQLVKAFAGDPVLLDLRPALRAAKEFDRDGDHAYYPLGTHWTDRGAAAGVAAIGERLRATAQGARWAELRPADLVYDEQGTEGDTWAYRLYLGGILKRIERAVQTVRGPSLVLDASVGSGDGYLVASKSDDPSLPSVLLFHDSFGQTAFRFIARCTSRGLARWDFFRPELVLEHKPDLVVELFVERVFGRPPVENLPQQEQGLRALFEAGTRGVFDLVPERDVGFIGTLGGVQAQLLENAIQIRWIERTALATLPPEALPEDASVLLRLDLEVPESVQANFHYKTLEAPAYGRANSLTRELPAGRSQVYLRIAAPNVRGPLALRINKDVPLTLHAVETRLVDDGVRR